MKSLPNLSRNILLFIGGLFVLTLGMEYLKKGTLNMEQPALFIGAIVLLGVFGGYMVSWVEDGKGR